MITSLLKYSHKLLASGHGVTGLGSTSLKASKLEDALVLYVNSKITRIHCLGSTRRDV